MTTTRKQAPKEFTRFSAADLRAMAKDKAAFEQEMKGVRTQRAKTWKGWTPPVRPDEVREVRKLLDLNREELGQVLGVSSHAVKYWEIGKRTPEAGYSKLLRLLKAQPAFVAAVRAA